MAVRVLSKKTISSGKASTMAVKSRSTCDSGFSLSALTGTTSFLATSNTEEDSHDQRWRKKT
jgi:hypothetical protein